MELKENRVLEKGLKRPLPSNIKEEPEGQLERKKTVFFLGERVVEPINTVIFENRVFFVERTSECLVIRPKTIKKYLKLVRGTKRVVRFERRAKDILIPTVAENPMMWFKEKYVEPIRCNQQGRFIQEVWKHRNEVFTEVMLG